MTSGNDEGGAMTTGVSRHTATPVEIRRIDYGDPRAVTIRDAMDVEMNALYAGVADGEDEGMMRLIDAALTIHPNEMVAAVGAFDGERLVGHAAMRPFEESLEVKRVIVDADYRGRGISRRLMAELEAIAAERGVSSLVLQTGDRQAEAIALYLAIGYLPIARFGLYEAIPFFLCYGKELARDA
jgi:GNAT superfamily N-acetyltransferase